LDGHPTLQLTVTSRWLDLLNLIAYFSFMFELISCHKQTFFNHITALGKICVVLCDAMSAVLASSVGADLENTALCDCKLHLKYSTLFLCVLLLLGYAHMRSWNSIQHYVSG
jgi:hypothetical protein